MSCDFPTSFRKGRAIPQIRLRPLPSKSSAIHVSINTSVWQRPRINHK
jgi:hypothetical protein